MPPYSGRFIELGIAKEATRGTPVAPTISVAKLDSTIMTHVEYVDIEASIGRIENTTQSVIVKKWSDGTISGPAFDIEQPYYWMGITGQAPTSAAFSGAFTHTSTMFNSNIPISLTFTEKDPIANRVFANSIVATYSMSIEAGALMTYEAATMGLGETTTPAFTPAYTAVNPFYSGIVTVKLAANRAGIGAAADIKAKSINISFDRTGEFHDKISSINPQDVLSAELKVEGTIELQHTDDSLKALSEAGTYQALQILAVNTGVTIGSTNPTLNIIFDKVALKEFERGTDLGSISQQTFNFTAYYNMSSGSMFDVVVTNSQASY